jgi:Asp-tRNA(Asn)/Glu-tRNA(Gln) amidotransferase A subunit family amidase
LYYIDGGKKLRDALGDEPMRPLTEWIIRDAKVLTAEQIETMVARRNQIRQQYYDYFNSLSLDVILCPAGPAPAQPIGTTKYWAYTSMWNLLDWPAAVFPTGLFVGQEDEEVFPESRNEHERHLYETCKLETFDHERSLMADSASIAEGSPIGLQVVAPRWQDERLMAALTKIDEVLPLA